MAQTFGMTLQLRAGLGVVERYKAEHAAAWPEVIARLRSAGILEMHIFLRGRRLFMFMRARDGFDLARDLAGLRDDVRYREWDELMRSLQEPTVEAEEGEWWASMEEVFDLSWPRFAEGRDGD